MLKKIRKNINGFVSKYTNGKQEETKKGVEVLKKAKTAKKSLVKQVKKTVKQKIKQKAETIGVAMHGKEAIIFLKIRQGASSLIKVFSTADKKKFKSLSNDLALGGEKNKKNVSDFRVSRIKSGGHFLSYKIKTGKTVKIKSLVSSDFVSWKNPKLLSFAKGEKGVLFSDFQHEKQNLFYFGEKEIKLAKSKDLKKWTVSKKPLVEPRKGYYDDPAVQIINPVRVREGILVFYFAPKTQSMGAALFNDKNPEELLWRSANPLWKAKRKNINPLNITRVKDELILNFVDSKGDLYEVVFPLDFVFNQERTVSGFRLGPKLKKSEENPILVPREEFAWESKASFNAAAIYLDGKVHILYRAVGDNDSSVLGYASSSDGVHIDERLPEPAYVPKEDFERTGGPIISLSPNVSGGGGYGGCEDPRITKIGDRIYLLYVAFNGANLPRLAMSSIDVDDFLAHRWNWEKAVLISKPGIIDKSGVLLPEKIKGKYVMFHRIFPNILIDFLDDIEFDGTKFLKGEFKIGPRKDAWDSRKCGVGATPLKTKHGWLVIYNGVDDKQDDRYKIGAMLLDLEDPRKILYRAKDPILEPTEDYENGGYKFGVVYPCGAAIVKGKLLVYYGGADKYLCLAEADVEEFIDRLKKAEPVKLQPIKFKKQAEE